MQRPSLNKTYRLCLSMNPETRARLGQHAMERHISMSQIVTEWIWNTKLKSEETPAEATTAVEN